MGNILKVIQIILAILLIVSVLIQQKGSGLGMAFGGDSNVFRSRRGLENVFHWSTIVIGALFCITALFTVFFS